MACRFLKNMVKKTLVSHKRFIYSVESNKEWTHLSQLESSKGEQSGEEEDEG